MDISGALTAVPSLTGRKCKLQRWLDTVPTDTPGYDELVAAIHTSDAESPHYRTQEQVVELLKILGLRITYMAVGRHRASPKRCVCDDV